MNQSPAAKLGPEVLVADFEFVPAGEVPRPHGVWFVGPPWQCHDYGVADGPELRLLVACLKRANPRTSEQRDRDRARHREWWRKIRERQQRPKTYPRHERLALRFDLPAGGRGRVTCLQPTITFDSWWRLVHHWWHVGMSDIENEAE